MLEKNLIKNFPWFLPVVVEEQDLLSEQKWHIEIDYRQLNDKTIEHKCSLPKNEAIFDKVENIFTTQELVLGFHKIEMNEESVEKTAFTKENGHYKF